MKKISIIILMAMISLGLSCASQQTPVSQPTVAAPTDFSADALNGQLQKYPVGGFPYKSAKINNREWDKWTTDALPVVNEILAKMPEGYVVQVTGHTDSRGPEEAMGSKPGNLKISTDRAKIIYDQLINKGVDANKLSYKGVGSSQPLPDVDPKSPEQRRVTFQVVAKESAPQDNPENKVE